MSIFRRRHPADVADLGHLRTELAREQAHSAALARQLADLREENRHLLEGRDHWRGEARRQIADNVNLRAQRRTAS